MEKMTSSRLKILGFLTEKQTLGLPAFNDAYSENPVTVGLKFKWRGGFLPRHLVRN